MEVLICVLEIRIQNAYRTANGFEDDLMYIIYRPGNDPDILRYNPGIQESRTRTYSDTDLALMQNTGQITSYRTIILRCFQVDK